jgi:hypothetical protein
MSRLLPNSITSVPHRRVTSNFETGKWRKIAEQLVTEPDPTKLLALVEQLNEEMDRAESARSTIDLL